MQYGGYGMAETAHQQQQQHQHQHQHQQFMEGDSCSSLFSISQKQSQLHYHHYHQPHLPPPPPPPEQEHKHERVQQHFFQLHPVPFTQQLLHHQQEYEAFQLQQRRVVLHQQMRLESELGGGGGGGRRGEGVGNGASLPFFNFKLDLNENSTGNREVVMNGEDQGDRIQEEHIPAGNRSNSLEMPPPPQCCWESREDGTIKEPFWKPLNPQLFNKNDKAESNDDEEKTEEGKTSKEINNHNNAAAGKNLGIKYTFFGELEAICGGARLGETNQAGSGSGLTGENLPRNARLSRSLPEPHCSNLGAAAAAATAAAPAATSAGAVAATGVDHGSEASIGEEGSVRNVERRKRRRRRRRRRRSKAMEELNSMAGFLESLVKQVMDHQEGLYRKFLQVVERIDEERLEREEAWRSQQLHNFNREATTRAHEQALASTREVAIVSYLEKITGQTINLPDKINNINTSTHSQPSEATKIGAGSSRWPKPEVQALIQVRSSLEARFQEPGLKGPLWEEISSSMAVMGYERSAKRCKEKWENINKYFRKTKDTNKKRSRQSKTCPYFHQLDQLYSRTPPLYRKGNSELLDAVVAINDPNITAPRATSAIDDDNDGRAEADPQMNHDAGDHENDDNTDVEEEEDQDMKDEEDEDDEQSGGGDGDEEDGD